MRPLSTTVIGADGEALRPIKASATTFTASSSDGVKTADSGEAVDVLDGAATLAGAGGGAGGVGGPETTGASWLTARWAAASRRQKMHQNVACVNFFLARLIFVIPVVTRLNGLICHLRHHIFSQQRVLPSCDRSLVA